MNLMLVFRNTAVNLRNSNNHQHRMHEKLKYNTLHRVLHQSSFTRYRRGLNCFKNSASSNYREKKNLYPLFSKFKYKIVEGHLL